MIPTKLNSASGLQKFVFRVQTSPSLEFCLLLKGEDLLLVDKVDEPEVFVEEAAVLFDAGSKVSNAHVLAALSLQAPQDGLFRKFGELHRQRAKAVERFRTRSLLEFCPSEWIACVPRDRSIVR